jgi:uncharacterized membrane protein YhaH (DUF805 family)
MQALRKVGAVARSVQANASSAFPTLNENISALASAPAPAAPVPKPAPQALQELALAPAWSKPGEETEQAGAPSARVEQAAGTGFSRPASPMRASRPGAAKRIGDDNVSDPVYADVPVFALSTQGRIGRLRYMAYFWPTMGLVMVAAILAAVVVPAMALAKPGIGMIALVVVYAIVLLWMAVRVLALRLHDLNKSGKWVLLPVFVSAAASASGSPRVVMMASAVFWILSIALMFWPGSEDDNDYGPPPAPNNELIYIGAALFLAFWAFGIVATVKYDKYAKTRLSEGATAASNRSTPDAQTDAVMRNYAQQLDAKTPVLISSMLMLDKVEYADNVLRYKATIQGKGLMISDEQKEALKNSLLDSYCRQDKGARLFPSNKVSVDFVFRYQVTAWDFESFTLKLSPNSCY